MGIVLVCLGVLVSSTIFTGVHGNGQATYYNPSVGVGACGFSNWDSGMVSAVSFDTFGKFGNPANPNNAAICRKCATVKSAKSGATVKVKIVDKSAGCHTNKIDLSPAAFQQLANLDRGIIPVDWHVHGC